MILALLLQLFGTFLHDNVTANLPTFSPDLTVLKGLLRMFWMADMFFPIHDAIIPLMGLFVILWVFLVGWKFVMIGLNLLRGAGAK